jgi:hypothetical protein
VFREAPHLLGRSFNPICAESELAVGLRDADPEAWLGVGKHGRAVLGYERAVDVLDI